MDNITRSFPVDHSPGGRIHPEIKKSGRCSQRNARGGYLPSVSILILILLAVGEIPACGKKGDPIPPSLIVPRAIQDLSLLSRSDAVFLIWSIPQTNIDASRLKNLKGFHIYRYATTASSPPAIPDPDLMEKIASVDYEYPSNARIEGKKVIFADRDIVAGKKYFYTVHSFTLRGYSSPPSNLVQINRLSPPGFPKHVQGKSGDRWAALSWVPPKPSAPPVNQYPVAGYQVFRSQQENDFPFFPVNPEPVTSTHYTDLGLENNRIYFYRVSAIIDADGNLCEGPPSPSISLVPKDTVAPLPPAGLKAVPTMKGVELNWEPGSESDLLGYVVYRQQISTDTRTRLTPDPILHNRHLDVSASPGISYRYGVSAVDNSPARNESEISELVTIKIPR